MNIPDDVRQAILICCSWAELYGHKVEEDAAYAVMEWLDAQPAAPTERWEPVEGYVQYEGASVDLEVDGAELHMYHDSGVDLVTILPDDLRLCRCVEVQP